MSLIDFRCKKCSFQDEYIVYKGLEGAVEPKECPKCKGEMERIFSVNDFQFDIIGWSPDNESGKKAWKKRLSQEDQAKVLAPDSNGNYKSPY